MSKFDEVLQLEATVIELRKALLQAQRSEAKTKTKTSVPKTPKPRSK
jgi:hypothetical protein